MGEIPYYLHDTPWLYPKASLSVLEVFSEILGVRIDVNQFDDLIEKAEKNIEDFLENFYKAETIPLEVRISLRDEIEKLKQVRPAKPELTTEEVTERIMEHINEIFKKTGKRDDRPH